MGIQEWNITDTAIQSHQSKAVHLDDDDDEDEADLEEELEAAELLAKQRNDIDSNPESVYWCINPQRFMQDLRIEQVTAPAVRLSSPSPSAQTPLFSPYFFLSTRW